MPHVDEINKEVFLIVAGDKCPDSQCVLADGEIIAEAYVKEDAEKIAKLFPDAPAPTAPDGDIFRLMWAHVVIIDGVLVEQRAHPANEMCELCVRSGREPTEQTRARSLGDAIQSGSPLANGQMKHEAWRAQMLRDGYADHPECNFILCDFTSNQHHRDMVSWEELTPERRARFVEARPDDDALDPHDSCDKGCPDEPPDEVGDDSDLPMQHELADDEKYPYGAENAVNWDGRR